MPFAALMFCRTAAAENFQRVIGFRRDYCRDPHLRFQARIGGDDALAAVDVRTDQNASGRQTKFPHQPLRKGFAATVSITEMFCNGSGGNTFKHRMRKAENQTIQTLRVLRSIIVEGFPA